MNHYKYRKELEKLIERLKCNLTLDENSKRIVLCYLLDELYYRVEKYCVIKMSDEDYLYYYNILKEEQLDL